MTKSPSWRFQVLTNPLKSGFGHFLAKQLGRNARKFIQPYFKASCKVFTPLEQAVLKRCSGDQIGVFTKLVRAKGVYQDDVKVAGAADFPLWNLKKCAKITDKPLKALIEHACGIGADPHIEAAIKLYLSSETAITKRYISYCLFAGMSDQSIGVRFRISPKTIYWFRMAFFDFSCMPKDAVGRWAYLAGLRYNKEIDDTDFAFYKRVYELGDLGIRAQVSFHTLTPGERIQVENFLGDTFATNVLALEMTNESYETRLNYNKVATGFGLLRLKAAEMDNLRMATQFTEARMKQLQSTDNQSSGVSADEMLTLNQMMQTLAQSKPDNPPYLRLEALADTPR